MIGDVDLLAFRQTYYHLFVELLAREPTPDVARGLGEALTARTRAARALHPLLGEGWEEVGRSLAGKTAAAGAEEMAQEFARLFLGPLGPQVNPYESYYLTGKVFERPLAVVRAFTERIGIERDPAYVEPEDSLAYELEIIRQLIARQAVKPGAAEEEAWADLQATFLKEHLLVWAPACALDLEQAKAAVIYRGVARLLRGFLALEADLVRDRGPAEVRSLDEAREGYRRGAGWRGPLFDPPSGAPPTATALGADSAS